MTTLREAAQMALDALELVDGYVMGKHEAKEALYEALAQPEQEPVAWWDGADRFATANEKDWDRRTGGILSAGRDIPLYTAPPQREWQYRRGDRLLCLETEEYCVIHVAGTNRQWIKFPDSHVGVYTNEQVAEMFELLPKEREWQGLTDEEMLVAAFKAGFDVHEDYDNEDDPDALHWWSEDGEPCDETLHKLRDIIEAKLKEKNA